MGKTVGLIFFGVVIPLDDRGRGGGKKPKTIKISSNLFAFTILVMIFVRSPSLLFCDT